jgi:hypothetical protein
MRRVVVVLVAAAMLAGCSAVGASPQPSASSTTADTATQKADAALILTMYADINAAFARSPSDGLTALIATQYPGDLADVDLARCLSALATSPTASPSPGATKATTPAKPTLKRLTYTPRIQSIEADPTFVLNSARVTNLHPKGRIYVTDIVITDGGRPTVRSRHQVVLDGRAYQFTTC